MLARRNALAIALVTAFASPLVAAPSALAVVAKFRISLKGTYTVQTAMTNSNCWRSDANDNVTYFTQHGQASENDTFQSTKPIVLTVSRLLRQRTVDAGSFSRLPVAFTLNRTSSADPPYCVPNDQYYGSKPDCGTKRGTYRIRVYGRTDRPAFSYLFSRGFTTYYPDDPFNSCPLYGGTWPGQLQTSGPAPVSPAKLFNRHIRTILVHGRNSGKVKDDPEGSERDSGSYKLSWTLTLRRKA